MSAFATPLIKFTDASTGYSNILIPVEQVQSAEPWESEPNATDIQQGINSVSYGILFTMVSVNSETKNIIINFDSEDDRDDALTQFYADCVTDITIP